MGYEVLMPYLCFLYPISTIFLNDDQVSVTVLPEGNHDEFDHSCDWDHCRGLHGLRVH